MMGGRGGGVETTTGLSTVSRGGRLHPEVPVPESVGVRFQRFRFQSQ